MDNKGGMIMIMHRVYEIDMCDVATLQCTFPDNDGEGYDRAKQFRNLLYNIQEGCIKDGEQIERHRYVIISD